MKQNLAWRSLAATAVLAVGLVGLPTMAHAEGETREVIVKLKEAQTAASSGNYAAAITAAKAGLAASKNGKDRELSLRTLMAVAVRGKDYRSAVSAVEGLLDGGFAKGGERLQFTKYIADLSIQTGDYPKALSGYQKYLEAKGGGASEQDFFNAAQVASLNRNPAQVMAFGDRAAAAGRQRSEKLLLLQYNAARSLGQAAKQKTLMDELARRFGKGEYIANMVAIYAKEKADRAMILNLYRLMADRGGFTGSAGPELSVAFGQELITAGAMSEANAFLTKAKLPKDDKAAGLLRQAASFSTEEQKTLAVKDKEARAGKNGENDYRVALAYFGKGYYTAAIEAARRALQPDRVGRVKRVADAQMLLGIALVRAKKAGEAKAVFAEAKKDPAMAAAADLWMAVAK